MKELVKHDAWQIIQEHYSPIDNEVFESLMSLGNGYMGMRGNHEETYSGKTLQGTYFAGVYYPDKTKVGWWKNGYPQYFAKVLNAVNFIGIDVELDGVVLDLAQWQVDNYNRILDMKNGLLQRSFTVTASNGNQFRIHAERFLSLSDRETGVLRYSITSLKQSATIQMSSYLDGTISNKDSNYDEKFWLPVQSEVSTEEATGSVLMKTKKTDFHVGVAMKNTCYVNQQEQPAVASQQELQYVAVSYAVNLEVGQTVTLTKFIGAATNRDYVDSMVWSQTQESLNRAFSNGYEGMKSAHIQSWAEKWAHNDIIIEGDTAAQQGIRFNIFHMNQTYTGEDEQLNIGPKGFTGEKYGGSTYWDTEAYCMYFYLGTAPASISRNLLIYRHKHLQKAKENAAMLGFKGALYPMVTMNGEECHNEWEITFEEIHRNAAIAYAIYNYVNYTNDTEYLAEYGFDVLAETARFWADRVNYVPQKDCYMILGVTGPNEYDNNVNNNWYTNKMAAWNMRYAAEIADWLSQNHSERFSELTQQLDLNPEEVTAWINIASKMYFPADDSLGLFMQQDGFMDKEQILVKDLAPQHLPLNQKWSWDRILRSNFIKQADVLQGLFFFEDEFTMEQHKKHFEFYEPRTVHESSLSPCVHSILASKLNMRDKAYDMYLRTSRLDLDNYNNDTEDGLHITSMAGTWMSVVLGFGGVRVKDNTLHITPLLPNAWQSMSFRTVFRGRTLKITLSHDNTTCERLEGDPLTVILNNRPINL